MNNIFNKKNHLIFTAILSVSLIITGIFVFIVYRSYFWSAFVAVIFYIGTKEYYNQISKLFGPKYKGIAPWLMIVLVSTVILLPSYFITRTLLHETLGLLYQFKAGFSEEKIINTLLQLSAITDLITDKDFFWVQLPEFYNSLIGSYVDVLNIDSLYGIVSNASSVIIGSIDMPAGFLANLFITIILLFFMYKEGNSFKIFIINIMPFPQVFEEKIGNKIIEAIEAILKGNLIISLLQGMVMYFLLLFVGIPNPFLYAVVASLFSLIPIVGTSVVWLPVGIYLLIFDNSPVIAIIFMVAGFSSYFFLENFLKPQFLDRKLNVHPLFLFLSLIGGVKEFGLTGLVIGPASVTILIILWDFVKMYNKGEFDL